MGRRNTRRQQGVVLCTDQNGYPFPWAFNHGLVTDVYFDQAEGVCPRLLDGPPRAGHRVYKTIFEHRENGLNVGMA